MGMIEVTGMRHETCPRIAQELSSKRRNYARENNGFNFPKPNMKSSIDKTTRLYNCYLADVYFCSSTRTRPKFSNSIVDFELFSL